jgi:hypothetical protein
VSERDPADDELGRAAYEAYLTASGGVSMVSGDLLPPWDNIPSHRWTAWVTVGQTVRAYVLAAEAN